MSKQTAVAYLRVSSDVNAGDDKDSTKRQLSAIRAYAKAQGLDVVNVFEDLGVSGTVHVEDRPGFKQMLAYLLGNGAKVILIESASRFARDAEVQLNGHRFLKRLGFKLIPVNQPDLFTADVPDGSSEFARQMWAALLQLEKTGIAHRLRVARDRKSAEIGRRVEGRPPFLPAVVAIAKRLRRRKGLSLRGISDELAKRGHLGATGKPFAPESVKRMLRK